MEILLLVIAGIVLYMLYTSFSDYMKNPYKLPSQDIEGYRSEYKPQDNPYIQLTDEDRIKKTEFGILAQILALIAKSDGKVCALERELLKDLFDDMAKELNEYNDYKDAHSSLQKIFDEVGANADLDALANAFVEATKGEYKKRVKVVEFLFALAYSDGVLDENEREKIIDVAAIFELNNDDFNKIYDDFERKYSDSVAISKDKALELLGLSEGFTRKELESAYQSAIKTKKQNIFKNLNKSFDNDILRKIDSAYRILGESLGDSGDLGESKLGESAESNSDSNPKDSSESK